MVNMKLILLVSLVVVFAEAVPVREHTLVKRGIFDNILESARNHLNDAATAVQQHLQTAREHIQRTGEQLRTHHENARDHLDRIGDTLGDHLDTVRDHLQNLADDSGFDLDLGNSPDTEEG
ncbi:uncharacterized protein LOC110458240 [Mizuhopecten yessoensis]|uniref:Uncharacterized protein n=1 Tax=Mizuhopecten yessoensis TaxID=6573 RepID=A0A210Q737_MIZYE|nr:uncharacterized protein LOC110458240 [Mizuhopecten yessoensis]OWF44546.1 hypothetical protein KP79_PYT17850 [Mizuhopecten yessoensis]